MHKLFYFKGTAALAPHIVLEELGAPYEIELVDFTQQAQKSEAYLSLNPKGRVPALLTEAGILTETPAILVYLAQTNPDAGLIPTEPFGFGQVQEFNNYLAATVHVAHAHKHRGSRWSDDKSAHTSMTAKVTENMTDCASVIERHYLKGPFVMGDKFTICDPYLYLVGLWLHADGVDVERFPKILQHFKTMSARPAVESVMKLHG